LGPFLTQVQRKNLAVEILDNQFVGTQAAESTQQILNLSDLLFQDVSGKREKRNAEFWK
jgi:hypothetical protein